jgi:hypothetical protein
MKLAADHNILMVDSLTYSSRVEIATHTAGFSRMMEHEAVGDDGSF